MYNIVFRTPRRYTHFGERSLQPNPFDYGFAREPILSGYNILRAMARSERSLIPVVRYTIAGIIRHLML